MGSRKREREVGEGSGGGMGVGGGKQKTRSLAVGTYSTTKMRQLSLRPYLSARLPTMVPAQKTDSTVCVKQMIET
jgi:hypothetical protein